MPVTIPATGTGTATPIVSTDNITADSSQVQNVQLVTVAAGVITRTAATIPVSLASVPSHAVTNAGTFAVQLSGVTLAAAAQVAVTATAGTLIAAATRSYLIVRNLSSSANSVFIGPATVTATTGMEVKPGEAYEYPIGGCPTNLLQAICAASGTATVIVQSAA